MFNENPVILGRLAVALALVGGEACAFRFAADYCGAWPWAAVLAALAACALWGHGVPFRAIAVPAAFAAGAVAAMRTECVRRDVADPVPTAHPAPRAFSFEVAAPVYLHTNDCARVASASFRSRAGPVPFFVTVPVAAGDEAPAEGEVWRCEGWVSRRKDEGRPFARRSFWSMRAARIAPARPDSLRARLDAWRREAARRLSLGLDDGCEAAGLHRALLLGERSGISNAERRMFAAAGTVHVFAISGLHVALVAGMASRVLAALPLPLFVKRGLLIPFVALYVLLAGAPPSAVRAAVMSILWCGAHLFRRAPDSLVAWSHAAICVYLARPDMVFDAGCSFSFAVMLGLVLWMRWNSAYVSFLRLPRRWYQCVRSFILWVWGLCTVSPVAWAAGVPVSAHILGSVSAGGVLSGVFAIPCAMATANLCVAAIAAGTFSDGAAAFFNRAAAASTECLVALSGRVASIPGVSFEVEKWSFLECAAWYGGAVLVFMALGKMRRRRADGRDAE